MKWKKLRSSQLADMSVPEIQVKFEHAKRLLAKIACDEYLR